MLGPGFPEFYVILGRPGIPESSVMLGRPGFPESYVMLGRPWIPPRVIGWIPRVICYVR